MINLSAVQRAAGLVNDTSILSVSRIGLIAGNGRFPFLVLQGARSLGHDVTIVAVKEEAFPELEQAAGDAAADLHWIARASRQVYQGLEGIRRAAGGHGRTGQACGRSSPVSDRT